MTRVFPSALLLGALAIALGDVRAEPLDMATCGQLKGEQARMEHEGVRSSMAKGPEWAKANLAADKLAQIRRLIDLDEQLLFRCSSRNLVELPPDADADPAPAKTDEEGKEAAPATKADAPPAKKPAAKAARPETAKVPAAPKTKEAAKTPPATTKAAPKKDAGAAPEAEKAAAVKPKPKSKVDDAYRPPPANPNVDPFANQPGVNK